MQPTKTRSSADTDLHQDEPLPHERDERARRPAENAQHRENRKPMEQARDDVEAGIQDTERIGTPSDVPSSGDNATP